MREEPERSLEAVTGQEDPVIHDHSNGCLSWAADKRRLAHMASAACIRESPTTPYTRFTPALTNAPTM